MGSFFSREEAEAAVAPTPQSEKMGPPEAGYEEAERMESEGKLILVEKLKGMQAQLQVRLTAVRELKPILRKVKFEEEIKAAQKKLAELADPPIAALESSLALNRARQCDLRDEEAAICSQLQELRSSAKQAAAEAAGFACKEARAAGMLSTCKDARAAGFTCQDAKAAGFTCRDAREAGFTCQDVKAAGFTCQDAKAAGFTCQDAKAAGFTFQDAIAAGFTCKEAREAGFTCKEAREAGFKPRDCYQAGFTYEEGRAAGFELVYSGWLTGAVGDMGPWAWSGKSPSGIRTLATAPPSAWRGAGRWLSREPAFPFSCAQIIMTGMGSQRARTWVLVDTGSTLEGWSKRTIKSACDGGPIAALRATVQRLAPTPRRPIDPRRGRIWGNCRGRRVYYHRGRRALRLADSTCVASTTGVVTDAVSVTIRLPFFAHSSQAGFGDGARSRVSFCG